MATSWCRICGKEYSPCPHCDPTRSWRMICDTEPHYQVWMIIHDYACGASSKDSAKECLRNLFAFKYISKEEIETFVPSVRDILHELMDDAEDKVDAADTPERKAVKRTTNRKGRA